MGLLDVRNSIITQLEHGKTREEIFNRMVKEDPGRVSKIAFAVAAVPRDKLRRQYGHFNTTLFMALIGIALTGLLVELPVHSGESTLALVLRVVMPLILSYFVFHFHGGIYRILGFWCLFDLVEHLLLGHHLSVVGAVKALLLVVSVLLAFYIARKVFSHLQFFGPKQDQLGRYFL